MHRILKKAAGTIAMVWALCASAVPIGSPGTAQAPVADPSPLEQAVEVGYAALNRKDMAGAKSAFESAAKRYPGSALPHIGLAEAARLEGQATIAEQHVRKAVAVEPASIEAHRALGRLYFSQGKYAEAEKTFKKAVALNPRSHSAHVDLAETYLNGLKNPALAAESYRNVISLLPRHTGAHMGLGAALASQGKYAEAIAAYQSAAALDPASPLALERLARLHAHQRQHAEAMKAIDAALEVAQKQKAIYPPGLVARGDLHAAAGDWVKAERDYRAAAEADRTYAAAWVQLGMALQVQKKWDAAEKAYLAGIHAAPGTFVAYNNLAWMAAERKERLDDAHGWIKKAIELAPAEPALYDTLAAVHRARGHNDLAIAAWEKAVATKHPHPSYLYRLGVAYAEAGRTREAAASLKKALAAGNDFPEAKDTRLQLQKLGGNK